MLSAFCGRATGARQQVDADEVRRALAVLADPEAGCEIRALPFGRTFILPGRDLYGLASAAVAMSDAKGIYYGTNPVPPTLDRTPKKADVLARRWLLVDIDPKRPGFRDFCATDQEKKAAWEVGLRLAREMAEVDWPAPVWVDSGNGYHLLFRIDLPNDEGAHQLCKKVLKRLAELFDTELAEVDQKCHDAPRIAKLPGTWAKKGTNDPDRPWRMAKMMEAPDPIEVVTQEQLEAFANPEPVEVKPDVVAQANGVHDPFRGRASGTSKEKQWAKRAMEKEIAAVATSKEGARNDTLNKAAFNLGQLVAGGLLDEAEVFQGLLAAARGAGLGEREAIATIQSGLAGSKGQPRTGPKPRVEPQHHAEANGEPEKPLFVLASDIIPKRVEWLWRHRIPLGKMTTFAGMGGLGKTLVLCDVVARVTTGAPWPDGEANENPGQVLYISGEDDLDDTLVPRLIACGADLSKIRSFNPYRDSGFTLQKLGLLDQWIKAAGPEARFLVIDPPASYLDGNDDNSNAELRTLLTPLGRWASTNRIAIVHNTHNNKGGGNVKLEAISRVMGSVAWVNAVRAAHMFARDPEDRSKYVFIPMKMNLCKHKKGLSYEIVDVPGELAKIHWLGEIDMTADEAVGAAPETSAVRRAMDWLTRKFTAERSWPSKELTQDAKEEDVSWASVRRAMEQMKCFLHYTVTGAGGHKVWWWKVKDDWTPSQEPQEQSSQAEAF